MSWFARSLVNTFRGNDDEDDGDDGDDTPAEAGAGGGWDEEDEDDVPGEEPGSPSRGVKEDLSEITKTLTRRLWGVASFLAPPPAFTEEEEEEEGSSSPEPSGRGGVDVVTRESDDAAAAAVESPRLAGIRSDLAEISGKVRSGISMLSQAKAVAEISKLASSFLPFGTEEDWKDEEEEVDAVGVTDEVTVFARSIAMHPETWLGCPLLNDDVNSDEFALSNAQQKHALAIEHFAPELADLRIAFCPSHMSESNFWKIYFVLLHSRLSKQDAGLLSTPQILEARTMLLQDLQIPKGQGVESLEREGLHVKEDDTAMSNERNMAPPSDLLEKTAQPSTASLVASDPVPMTDETEKHAVETNELKVVDKSVIEEPIKHEKTNDSSYSVYKFPIQQHEEDGDEWLDDDTGEGDNTKTAMIQLGQEEDVSFSDLEDDDTESDIRASSSKTEDSIDWVHLNKDGKGSNEVSNSTSPLSKETIDWLNLEDIDVE